MASKSIKLPLVVIVGPTASGKTALAIELAAECNGEIICADSRTVYKDMDIGTAKPSQAEQARVPHWGIDLIAPGDYFSAADFKQYAVQKIEEIRARGHVPFLTGGTGLYIDAVLFDYQFGDKGDVEQRQKLQQMTLEQLYEYCKKNNVILPENFKNKRYVIRAIENKGASPQKRVTPLEQTIVVGIATEKIVLRTRIEQRAEQLFEDSVVNEAKMLGKKYGWDNEAMRSNIYPLIRLYLEGSLSLDDVKNKFITLDWRLAKRQMTWLRRNTFIHWASLNDAKKYLVDQLAIYQ
ncbi:tRNA (adenosine(37)-N6)-dimethylallyltransferase MiaA [Candidatus Saccharibacteria bacterium]|nr:tRNA (adenosine(37)-N6)-dimethylallyltransferase MiaA [Candidatus Saccharibacteria bacterium]